jgi:uncharacterized protein Usg
MLVLPGRKKRRLGQGMERRAVMPRCNQDAAPDAPGPERSEMELTGIQHLARFRLLPDWRLTTAEILYHMPDHPGVLQTFLWQKHDLAPRFPELGRFLDFWRREIEAPLHSVRVASAALMRPAELRYADGQFLLN